MAGNKSIHLSADGNTTPGVGVSWMPSKTSAVTSWSSNSILIKLFYH